MKIRDIVAESSELDEALGTAWNLAKAAGKELIGKSAQAAAKDAEAGLKGQGPKWAQWVNQQADKVAAAKGAAGASAHVTARATFTTTSAFLSALKTYEMIDPYLVYSRHMDKWDAAMKKGAISPEQYETIRAKELTQLVAQWTTILATNGLLRASVFPVLGVFKVFGLNTMYSFVNSMTKAAQYTLMLFWNSAEGRKWIASILALAVVDDQDWASAIIGGNIASLIDKVKGKVRNVPANEPAGGAATGGQGQQPAEPVAAPEKTNQPAASNQKTNPQDYEFYSDTLVKNKKTGKLELKDF